MEDSKDRALEIEKNVALHSGYRRIPPMLYASTTQHCCPQIKKQQMVFQGSIGCRKRDFPRSYFNGYMLK